MKEDELHGFEPWLAQAMRETMDRQRRLSGLRSRKRDYSPEAIRLGSSDEGQLLRWVEDEEHDSEISGWGVAPLPYQRLAILYRKRREFAAEVLILERFSRQKDGGGVLVQQLAKRLLKARELLEKQRAMTATALELDAKPHRGNR